MNVRLRARGCRPPRGDSLPYRGGVRRSDPFWRQAALARANRASACPVSATGDVSNRRAARSARRSAMAGTRATSAIANAHLKVWPKAVATGPPTCPRSPEVSGASSPSAPPLVDDRSGPPLVLEHDGKQRGADRAADLAQGVDCGGGARHLRRVEQCVGGRGRRLIGSINAAPMPCGASSRPAFSALSPRSTWYRTSVAHPIIRAATASRPR
jgi:hypothetical protein